MAVCVWCGWAGDCLIVTRSAFASREPDRGVLACADRAACDARVEAACCA